MEKGSSVRKNDMQKGHSRWKETKVKRWREGKTTGSTEAGTKETKLV